MTAYSFSTATAFRRKQFLQSKLMKRLLAVLCVSAFLAGVGCAPKPITDGAYAAEVTLLGGSGRASVQSPATITVTDGEMTATVIWSSPFYEWMQVDGVQYDPVQTEGNAMFVIPITLDTDIACSALTVAMSEPHEVDYTLRFDSASLKATDVFATPERSMELQYATQFNVDYYANGLKLLSFADGSRYLIMPEGGTMPAGMDGDITVLHQPIENMYLVATSAMCLFDALDGLSAIRLSGTKADGWYNENARAAMEAGDIQYAGKYSEPDYELILASDCGLAIESTMIGHAPEVREKLEDLGVPVLVDLSSQEKHPLGRTEWIKLYGALLNKETQAERIFNEQVALLDIAATNEPTGKTVAFFYISTSGYAIARKSGDYVTKMIELAGGDYIFDDLGDSETATSTVTLEMETFYATAKNADYIIYNSTIGGELHSLSELLSKNQLLTDFRAVQNGNVWCTSQNLFQETTQLGGMILDMHRLLTEPDATELDYLYKLQ